MAISPRKNFPKSNSLLLLDNIWQEGGAKENAHGNTYLNIALKEEMLRWSSKYRYKVLAY